MFFSKPGDQNQAVSGTKHIFFGRPEYHNQAQSTILTTTIRLKVRFGAKPEWRRPHLGTNLLLRVGSGNHNQALSTFLATAIRRPGPGQTRDIGPTLAAGVYVRAQTPAHRRLRSNACRPCGDRPAHRRLRSSACRPPGTLVRRLQSRERVTGTSRRSRRPFQPSAMRALRSSRGRAAGHAGTGDRNEPQVTRATVPPLRPRPAKLGRLDDRCFLYAGSAARCAAKRARTRRDG